MQLRSIALCAAMALGACAEGNSIYHQREVKSASAQVYTMDAKQRSIFVLPETGAESAREAGPAGVASEAQFARQWRVCAEPPPDVFSAISASAGLEGNLTERKAKFAASIAETAATVERTQTINLLRESMYRTCERYLSGALSKSSFVIQAARDQRTMLAVLAIEQLTRTARPPSTVLAPSGTNSSIANDDAASLVKQFAEEKATAKAAQDKAETDFNNARKKSDCDAIQTAPAADPELADWSACTAAKQVQEARRKDYSAATERLDKVIAALPGAGSTGAGTTAGTGSTGAGGGGLSEAAIEAVSDAVTKIALNSGFDEALMFCVGYLSAPPVPIVPTTVDLCNQMVAARFGNDEKARSGILSIAAGGTDIQVASVVPPPPGDRALPVLRAYLDPGLPKAEADRRFKLVARAAARLGLARRPADLPMILSQNNPEVADRLVTELRITETDAAGRKVLEGN